MSENSTDATPRPFRHNLNARNGPTLMTNESRAIACRLHVSGGGIEDADPGLRIVRANAAPSLTA
jgi:hypothetical protein